MSEGYFINEGEKMYFPEGVKPMIDADAFLEKTLDEWADKNMLDKIRERVTEDIAKYGPGNDTSTILQHKVIDSYILLQILDTLESMSLSLDAMLDYNAAQWHERKVKE